MSLTLNAEALYKFSTELVMAEGTLRARLEKVA